MVIEERIYSIEKKFGHSIPGTILNRILTKEGSGWSIGFGVFNGEKQWFYGKTIEDVLDQAEKFIIIENERRLYDTIRKLK